LGRAESHAATSCRHAGLRRIGPVALYVFDDDVLYANAAELARARHLFYGAELQRRLREGSWAWLAWLSAGCNHILRSKGLAGVVSVVWDRLRSGGWLALDRWDAPPTAGPHAACYFCGAACGPGERCGSCGEAASWVEAWERSDSGSPCHAPILQSGRCSCCGTPVSVAHVEGRWQFGHATGVPCHSLATEARECAQCGAPLTLHWLRCGPAHP
jgi:hypothetical protein